MNEHDDRLTRSVDATRDKPKKLTAQHGGSMSMNAPGLRPSLTRLAAKNWRWYLASTTATLIVLLGGAGAVLFIVARLAGMGVFVVILSLPFLLIAAGTWWFTVMLVRRDALAVAKGLLSPGIVAPDRRSLVCLANLSWSESRSIYGVRVIPFRGRSGETEVPCSCVFSDGGGHDHYKTFTPVPLRYGSSDAQAIDACHERIDAELWDALRTVIVRIALPKPARILVLSEQLEPLKVLDDIGHEVSPEKLQRESAEVSQGGSIAGLLMIGIGVFIFSLGAIMLSTSLALGEALPPPERLALLAMFMGLGLVAIAIGVCMRIRLWGTATILFLFGACLGIVFVVFASML